MQTKEVPFVITVSQLTLAIKQQLENTFSSIWLQGEASNVKLHSSGHLYFSLKDDAAQIACVMFRRDLATVGSTIKNGDKVTVQGDLTVWPPRGSYQLVVRHMSLMGVGAALLQFELLKKKLLERGWFDADKKKQLPHSPEKIGIVTSPTGAVIRDIIHVLERRLLGFHIIVNPVHVQGETAATEVARAIQTFNQYNLVDVIIVARGGGSLEDLMPFNTELVAEAIFKSTIPVISAVGHETDTTIADFVADVRAPTPSAAAEIVAKEQMHIHNRLKEFHTKLHLVLRRELIQKKEALRKKILSPVLRSPTTLLSMFHQDLDLISEKITTAIRQNLVLTKQKIRHAAELVRANSPKIHLVQIKRKLEQYENLINTVMEQDLLSRKRSLKQCKEKIDTTLKNLYLSKKQAFFLKQFRSRIDYAISAIIKTKKTAFKTTVEHLNSVHPKRLLEKGYSILFAQKTNSVITSTEEVSLNQEVTIALHNGSLEARIIKISKTPLF